MQVLHHLVICPACLVPRCAHAKQACDSTGKVLQEVYPEPRTPTCTSFSPTPVLGEGEGVGTQTPAPLLPGLNPRGEVKSQPSLQEPKEQLALPEQAGARRGSESLSVSSEAHCQPIHRAACPSPTPDTIPSHGGAQCSQAEGSSSALGHLALEGVQGLRLVCLRSSLCDTRVPGCSLNFKQLYAAAE